MDEASELTEILQTLLGLRDLDALGDVGLLDLARDARLETLRKGEVLQADEHLDRHVYLVEGEVELVADGRVLHSVKAGTERALSPLFRVHTHGLTARCVSEARLLSLDEDTFEHYAGAVAAPDDSGIAVEEYSLSDEQNGLIDEIRRAFVRDEVELPSMPEVAMKISRAVQDRDTDIRSIAAIVQTDPVIAARIVRVANSAMYRGVSRVESVQNAITRIGLQATRAIVMSVVMRSLFTPVTPLVGARMKRYYRHSIRVGAISHALAARLAGFDPEEAFLAGLLHDIGTLPVLIRADVQPALNREAGVLEKVIAELGHEVGAMLLERWDFEPEFVTVAREAEDWFRDVAAADYCDMVQIAQLHCGIIGGRKIEDAPPMNQLPAFGRLGLDAVDPVEVIREARQEIGEIVALLAS